MRPVKQGKRMRRPGFWICLVAALACVLAPSPAKADIPVANASFETPFTSCCSFPDGWSQGGTAVGDAGNWDPTSDPNSGLAPSDAFQVAYINNYYNGADDSTTNYWYLAQTLNIPGGMVPGDVYTLIYDVAVRADLSNPAWFRVQINGNYSPTGCTTCFAITRASTGSFIPGPDGKQVWYPYSVSYSAQPADAGKQPTIYLVNDGSVSGGLAQVEFDVGSPHSPFTVPEPGSILLLVVMLAGALGAAKLRLV
jgi:hypothetical protein